MRLHLVREWAQIRELKLPEGHGRCHSADEAQSIANLQKAIRIYVLAIEKLNLWMTGEKINEK